MMEFSKNMTVSAAITVLPGKISAAADAFNVAFISGSSDKLSQVVISVTCGTYTEKSAPCFCMISARRGLFEARIILADITLGLLRRNKG